VNGLYHAAVARIQSLKGTRSTTDAGIWLTTYALLDQKCKIEYNGDGPREVMGAVSGFIVSMPDDDSITVFCELMRIIL
jgi:hypothetical protein